MTIQEFVKRQNEYMDRTAVFTVLWNDGEVVKMERKIRVPGEFKEPHTDWCEVLGVEVK